MGDGIPFALSRLALNTRRSLLSLVLVATLASQTGCIGKNAAKVLMVAAVVAVKTAQVVAASSRHESRTKISSGAAPSASGEGCGHCEEPENGYAVCFVSTCEVRCIEGYALAGRECLPLAHTASSEPSVEPSAR